MRLNYRDYLELKYADKYVSWFERDQEVATVFFQVLFCEAQGKPWETMTRITYWPDEIWTFQIQIMSVKKLDNLKVYDQRINS
jgi:hypothetical protein